MKKPKSAVYHHLAATYGLGESTDCLFIDDSARNVATARQLGLDSIRFVSPDQLRTELARRGLPPR